MPVLDFSAEGIAEDSLDFSKEGEPAPDFSSEGIPEEAVAVVPSSEPERQFVFDPEADYPAADATTLKEFFAAQLTSFVSLPKPGPVPDAPKDAGLIEKTAAALKKTVAGLAESGIGAVESVLTPATAEIAAVSAIPVVGKPAAIAAGVGFGAHTAITGSQQFYEAVKRGDVQGAAKAAGDTFIGTFLVGSGYRHAAKGEVPVVATKLAPVTAKAYKEAVGETETFAETAPTALPQEKPTPTPPSPVSAPLTAIAAKSEEIPVKMEPEKPVVEGPGAATTGFTVKSELDQLTDVVRGMEKSSIPWQEQLKASIDASIQNSKDIGDAALGTAKGTYAFLKNKLLGPPGFTEWKRGISRWDAEDQLTARSAYHFAKETAKVIPQPARQAAISKWIDAGGDPAILQAGEATTRPEFKQAYRDAQNLSPEELNLAKNIQNYFDAKLQDAIDSGLLESGLDNYIHRIYPKEGNARNSALAAINAGTLQPNPGLIRRRLFEFDYEAEAAGFNPVQGFAERILAYDQAFNRALSARSFIKWLQSTHKEADGRPSVDIGGMGKVLEDPVTGARKSVLINPHYKTKGLAPGATPAEIASNNRADYIAYDHPALRRWKWAAEDADGKPILVQGDLLVHKDRVKKLDALLGKSWWQEHSVPRTLLKASNTVKQTMLDLSLFHPVQIKFHSLEHRVTKLREIDFMDKDQRALIDHSLVIFDHRGHRMFSEGVAGGSLTKHVPVVGAKLHEFHDFVFKEWIPKVKMTMAVDALARNRKRFTDKLSDDDILYLTAKQSNAAFGFQNYRDMGMHPSMQDALRATMLAPDFLMSRMQFVGQGATKYGKEQLEALALGAFALFVMARIGNKISTDEWQWDKPFSVVVKGRQLGIRSVQEDLYHAIADTRKFIFGRINPLTTRTAIEYLTGRDYRGVKRDLAGQLEDLGKLPIPIAFKTDDQKQLWESFVAAMGITIKRASAAQEIFKLAQEWKKDQGIEEPGEFIYDPDKDPYRKLKIALSIGDEDDARKALAELKEDKALALKVTRHMTGFYNRPFSGTLARESKFKQSLSADKQKLYEDAKAEKRASLELFRKINR